MAAGEPPDTHPIGPSGRDVRTERVEKGLGQGGTYWSVTGSGLPPPGGGGGGTRRLLVVAAGHWQCGGGGRAARSLPFRLLLGRGGGAVSFQAAEQSA
jgi:hypothetical protein